jgi:hypothetical protein
VFDQTVLEVSAGRMSPLVASSTHSRVVTRRFPVQQRSSSGKLKVRIIDDFKESLVNSSCEIAGRIHMGSVRHLSRICLSIWRSSPSRPLVLAKADFSKAYRCCPISAEHLPFADVILRGSSGVLRSTQWAMPFGAIAAVYAWDRVGEAVVAILRRGLALPVSRYVDDLFWPDWASISD